MAGVSAIDVELERLLYRRDYRRAFCEGQLEIPELSGLDRGVLDRLAERIVREVFARKYLGSGSLLDVYPGTIKAACRAISGEQALLELGYAFLESAAFERHRELPFTGVGIAIEHAFFEFTEHAELGDPVLREHEFLAAMIRLLVVSPRAAIELPDGIHPLKSGFYAVSERGRPTLFAALGGRYVSGPLTPFLAELLAPDARPAAVAARHGVEQPVLKQALSQLSALGLVAWLE